LEKGKAILKKSITCGIIFAVAAIAAAGQSILSRASDTTPVIGIDLSERRYGDGSYLGESVGYRPGLVVEVTVKDGRVADVRIIEHKEVRIRYWRRAMKLIPREIVRRQSTGIDALSGATATSNGILAAVENALGEGPPPEKDHQD
jgi:uncharacterized protein with FMN-binding domain